MRRDELLRHAAEVLEAWNHRNPEEIAAVMAPEVVYRDVAMPRAAAGRDAIRAVVETYLTAFPDLRLKVDRQVVDGNVTVHEFTATGTHQGEVLGISATGAHAEVHGCAVTEWGEDGLIHDGMLYWGVHQLLEQLGVIAALARTPA